MGNLKSSTVEKTTKLSAGTSKFIEKWLRSAHSDLAPEVKSFSMGDPLFIGNVEDIDVNVEKVKEKLRSLKSDFSNFNTRAKALCNIGDFLVYLNYLCLYVNAVKTETGSLRILNGVDGNVLNIRKNLSKINEAIFKPRPSTLDPTDLVSSRYYGATKKDLTYLADNSVGLKLDLTASILDPLESILEKIVELEALEDSDNVALTTTTVDQYMTELEQVSDDQLESEVTRRSDLITEGELVSKSMHQNETYLNVSEPPDDSDKIIKQINSMKGEGFTALLLGEKPKMDKALNIILNEYRNNRELWDDRSKFKVGLLGDSLVFRLKRDNTFISESEISLKKLKIKPGEFSKHFDVDVVKNFSSYIARYEIIGETLKQEKDEDGKITKKAIKVHQILPGGEYYRALFPSFANFLGREYAYENTQFIQLYPTPPSKELYSFEERKYAAEQFVISEAPSLINVSYPTRAQIITDWNRYQTSIDPNNPVPLTDLERSTMFNLDNCITEIRKLVNDSLQRYQKAFSKKVERGDYST